MFSLRPLSFSKVCEGCWTRTSGLCSIAPAFSYAQQRVVMSILTSESRCIFTYRLRLHLLAINPLLLSCWLPCYLIAMLKVLSDSQLGTNSPCFLENQPTPLIREGCIVRPETTIKSSENPPVLTCCARKKVPRAVLILYVSNCEFVLIASIARLLLYWVAVSFMVLMYAIRIALSIGKRKKVKKCD